MSVNCKYCKKGGVPEGALFCPWCGEKLVRARKKKAERVYPKFRVLSDGTLLGQIMLGGKRETVKASNEAEYKAKIDGLRTGVLEMKNHPEKRTLETVVRAYIDKNDAVLSPSTICGYEVLYKNRFKGYAKKSVGEIDFQAMVNDEVKECSPKTLKNAWGLVRAALRDAGIQVPDVNLPSVPRTDGDFLDYEQIQTFLKAVKGDSVECAALLLLHSLRLSEAMMLTADNISDGVIHVRGAVVVDKNNRPVVRAANKTAESSRDIPIMIPRLLEILPESGPLITIARPTVQHRVKKVCTSAGLPPCSPHDLRRSFASLAKHLGWMPDTLMRIGGWSDLQTVNRIYAKLSEQDKNADIAKMKNYYGITTKRKKSSNNASHGANK